MSCTTSFKPKLNRLRHLHFRGITDFNQGLTIQNQFVRANLDHKKMEAKIRLQQQEILEQGYKLSDYEEDLLQKILDLKPLPTVLSFEFNSVYTGGKREKKATLQEDIERYEQKGAKYYQLERGGQVTYHGPGQLVAYPIIDLKNFTNLQAKCYISVLEKAMTNSLLKNYGLETIVDEGIYMKNKKDKLGSIGVNLRRSISSFGVSLNVSTDLSFMNDEIMCGKPDKRAISLHALGIESNVKVEAYNYVREFAKLLNIDNIEHMSVDANELIAGDVE